MLARSGRQPRHLPRHSRSRDGLTRAVLIDDAGRLPRSARVVARSVALLLAVAVGALLVSLVAGSPVPGISDPLPWREHPASHAAQPRAESSTPADLATSSAASTPPRRAPARSRSASPADRPRRTDAGSSVRSTPARTSAGARGGASSAGPSSPSKPAASPSATPSTPPGVARTHANTTHPQPTNTHHP